MIVIINDYYTLQMILSSYKNIFEGKNLVTKPGKTQCKTLVTTQPNYVPQILSTNSIVPIYKCMYTYVTVVNIISNYITSNVC